MRSESLVVAFTPHQQPKPTGQVYRCVICGVSGKHLRDSGPWMNASSAHTQAAQGQRRISYVPNIHTHQQPFVVFNLQPFLSICKFEGAHSCAHARVCDPADSNVVGDVGRNLSNSVRGRPLLLHSLYTGVYYPAIDSPCARFSLLTLFFLLDVFALSTSLPRAV